MIHLAIAAAAVLAFAPLESEAPGPTSGPPPPWRGVVLVLAAESEDAVVRNARARIAGELAAAPFRVVERPLNPDVDLLTQVEAAGDALTATATFAIVQERARAGTGDASPERAAYPPRPSVAVWVSNRLTNLTTIQRLEIDADHVDRAARRLAIEAVETIRASLGELWPRPGRARGPFPELPPETSVAASAPPAPPAGRFSLSLALGMVADGGRSPTLWAPALAAGYGRGALEVRLRAMGSGLAASVSGPDGSGANLRRGVVSLALVRVFRVEHRVRPLLLVEAGAQVLDAEPVGAPPERSHRRTAWSGLAAAGGGLRIMLGGGLALEAEAQVIVLWPPTTVRAATTDVARFDRPALLARAGLLATF